MKLLVWLLAAASSTAFAHETVSLEKEFKTSGKGMERLMSRVLEDGGGGDNNGSGSSTKHLAQYTIKFQGCHHIQQWNEDADDNDEVKIMTKRLVRFRLVPANQCSNYDFKTVSAKYGDIVNQYVEDAKSTVSKYTDIFDDFADYVVDLNTFVYAYLEGKAEEEEGRCEIYADYCSDMCAANGYSVNNDDDGSNTCLVKCYRKFGLNCNTYANNIDPIDYAQCAALDFQNDDDAGNEYYLGPYCADQGGVIKMGIFTDNTCSTFADCGASCYETKTGYNLPGAGDDGIISESCMSCSSNYVDLETTVNAKESISDFSFGYPRNVCTNIYAYSGKCESHMKNSPDKTDSGCSYINGIKILASDGTVDARPKVRSTAADLSMAILATGCVFFGMYIFYLKDKLSATRFK